MSWFFASGFAPVEKLPDIFQRFSHYFQTDLLSTYKKIYQHLKDVEDSFPGGLWSNDYFEFARKYIFPIYLIGMIQIFLESISLYFLIPLFFGLNLKGTWSRSLLLLLSVIVGFLVMDYFFIVSRNFIASRYMLVPVVLSFTLVGYGTERLVSVAQKSRYREAVLCSAIILCLLFPLVRTYYKSFNEKHEIKQAGVWLGGNRDLSHVRMIVTEERVAYYAGLFRESYKTAYEVNHNLLSAIALKEDYDIVVVYLKLNNLDQMTAWDEFNLVKTFEGRKKVVMIYERKT